jgi:hypothetical protein
MQIRDYNISKSERKLTYRRNGRNQLQRNFHKKAAPANSKINLSNEVNFSKTNCQFF